MPTFHQITDVIPPSSLPNISIILCVSFCRWAQGYDGSRAEFITRDVVCFKCGNIIKFVQEDGTESVCSSPGDGVGPLAVHSINKVFAFADQGVESTIYVFKYPSFERVSELVGK